MPYTVKRDTTRCPARKPYALVKDDDNRLMGCHPNEVMANRQLAALHASEAARRR